MKHYYNFLNSLLRSLTLVGLVLVLGVTSAIGQVLEKTEQVNLAVIPSCYETVDDTVWINKVSLGKSSEDGIFNQIGKWGESAKNLMEVSGDFVIFVQDEDLVISDYTNPLLPMEISRTNLNGVAKNILISDDKVYLGMYSGDIRLFDISLKNSPSLLSVVQLPEAAKKMKISGTTLYASYGYDTIEKIVYSTPNSPHKLGKYVQADSDNYSPLIVDFDVNNDIVYILYLMTGIGIFDFTDINNPIKLSSIGQETPT